MEFFHRPRQLAGSWRAEASSFVIVVQVDPMEFDVDGKYENSTRMGMMARHDLERKKHVDVDDKRMA